jgi:DNA-directed RNA polymerase subunit L/DNA-directed RNA polymerase alpha subunit
MNSSAIFQLNHSQTRANTIQFQMNPTHVAYANTLRRLCMIGVETIGFRADIREDGATSDVQVKVNTTPMTNEMLAHRIGLIPIYVPDPLSWDPNRYSFVLHAVNETDEVMDVFASQFKVFETKGVDDRVQVASRLFFPPNEVTGQTCLLATLKPMMPGGKPEEILLEAKATRGIGRENARFIPTSQCSYGYTRDTDPVHQKQAFEQWLQRAKMIPDASVLDQTPEKKTALEREFQTLETNRCYLKNDKGEPYSFDFTIESVGVLDPAYIVRRACEAGATLCSQYTSDVLPPDVQLQRTDGFLHGFDYFFQKQDHTLGHLIQAWIDEHLIDHGEVTFVGYDIPHPLRDEMVLRIGVAENVENDEVVARQALQKAMAACQAMFLSWKDQWLQVAPSASVVAPSSSLVDASAASIPSATAKRTILRRPTPKSVTTES